MEGDITAWVFVLAGDQQIHRIFHRTTEPEIRELAREQLLLHLGREFPGGDFRPGMDDDVDAALAYLAGQMSDRSCLCYTIEPVRFPRPARAASGQPRLPLDPLEVAA